MSNFWLIKEREAIYLRIIRWAQRNRVKVEALTQSEICEVIKMKD